MSAVHRIHSTPDDATLDLWRVAETGDVRELASVLPRVRDINAQNEHGVTALMRAAQFGHVKMVRALLEHGADANLKRNDKFTALALAAFFGHTEIVRALMEHGADLQASTRNGTSPQMWATARTFNEVADQLEKPAPVEKAVPVERLRPRTQPQPAPAPLVAATPVESAVSTNPVVRATMKAAEVRTLKDPPEIWDLVHEVPRGFDARSAFVTRLKSTKTGLAVSLAVLIVLAGAGVVGVMALRGVQARIDQSSAITTKQPVTTKQPAAATMSLPANPQTENATQPAAVDTSSGLTPLPSLPTAETGVTSVDQPLGYRKPGVRSRFRSQPGERNVTPPVAASATVQPVAAAPAKVNTETRAEAQPKAKDSSGLSPQMIAPAKTATPKGKVIQWP
jgi:hypothetical protein